MNDRQTSLLVFAMMAPIFILAVISPLLTVLYGFAVLIIILGVNAIWIEEATKKRKNE